MILKAQMQTVFSSLRWYAADRYGLLIAVGCVGGNFNQTVGHHLKKTKIRSLSDVKYTLQVGTFLYSVHLNIFWHLFCEVKVFEFFCKSYKFSCVA